MEPEDNKGRGKQSKGRGKQSNGRGKQSYVLQQARRKKEHSFKKLLGQIEVCGYYE